MEFRVLGPLVVTDRGTPVRLSALRQRAPAKATGSSGVFVTGCTTLLIEAHGNRPVGCGSRKGAPLESGVWSIAVW